MEQPIILVVDDDQKIREVLRILLEDENFIVIEMNNGNQTLDFLEKGTRKISLIILDVMIEGLSGYQVCAQLRKKWNIPVLFLTAKSQDSDLMLGYSVGGDDYLAKPFSYAELLARVKGLIRRYTVYKGENSEELFAPIEWKGIRIDRNYNEVSKCGQELKLTEIEYQILNLLISHRGKIFSLQNLYESIWKEPYFITSNNTIMVHIRKLREKIESNPNQPVILKTVWGKGYRIE